MPRGRKVPDDVQKDLDVCWRHITAADLVGGWVTSPIQTVLDCVRSLPADEGLAIPTPRCAAVASPPSVV